jgi:hypothetical protein
MVPTNLGANLMPKTTVADLAAKVVGLEIILEMLLVDQLAKDQNPKAIGDGIVKSALESEEKVRQQFGDHPLAMKVTETISSLIDRAVKRAVERRNRLGHSSPK